MTSQHFVQSSDTLPQAFMVVPHHSYLRVHKAVRIIALCQTPLIQVPSITDGGGDSLHVTDHRGYIIKYPRNREHRCRNGIKQVITLVKNIARLAVTAAVVAGGDLGHSGDVAVSALSSLHQTVENRARLYAVGINPKDFFSVQFVVDDHQKRPMEDLLRDAANVNRQPNITGNLKGIVLENGRTFWVCDRSLAERESEMDVTLCNPDLVDILTETFTKSTKTTKTTKIIIHLDPSYFEAPERATGSRFDSIADRFNKLGAAFQRQKMLAHLEIHCNSTNGKVYTGLQAVL
ncbi:hypothetical protein BGZ65_005833, partial [Modicella reniformis]